MMRKLFWILSISLLVSQTACETKVAQDSTPIATNDDWKKLTVRQKIGQTMMVTSDYNLHKRIGDGSLEAFFEKYPVGGFFIAEWLGGSQRPADTRFVEFVMQIMREYNAASPLPLFFSEDFEKGTGNQMFYDTDCEFCTKMPSSMALGAANNPDFAYAFGKIVSQESRAMGFNWLLHPVADLNMNPLHPLVVERSISDKAEIAIPILRAQASAMKEHGIISTIKHFPGDGATIRDQHLITAANNLSLEEWKKTFGKVFETMIKDEAPSIMVGHLQFPAYQNDPIDGVLPPATLSKDIMTKLLKKEMGYKGVVISDAMNMGGPVGYYDNVLEASIQCFLAGCDMILWPAIEYMDTVEARINRGEIPMSRLDDAVERIWALREKYDLLTKKSEITSPLPADHVSYKEKNLTALAESAVTLIQDKNNDIPLCTQKIKKIMLVNISYHQTRRDREKDFDVIKDELIARGFEVDIVHDFHLWDWEWRMNAGQLDQYDKFIACFENGFLDPTGAVLLKGREAYSLWMIKMLPKNKIISISFSNPYYNTFYLSSTPLLINAYSRSAYMQRAVVKVLMGDVKATATSPVDLYNPIMR
jgi:beta-N-acetylhexosaminidase